MGSKWKTDELVKKYGEDALRYYLLRYVPTGGDGDFSIDRFKSIYQKDLAGGLGNLFSRLANYI